MSAITVTVINPCSIGEPEDGEVSWVNPFVFEPDNSFLGATARKPKLAVDEETNGPWGFIVQHRHDGTMLFTQEAISAVTKSAELYAERGGGEWAISRARVVTVIERGEMPYGKNVVHILEAIAIFARCLAAPSAQEFLNIAEAAYLETTH
jgi:hypothetical protein